MPNVLTSKRLKNTFLRTRKEYNILNASLLINKLKHLMAHRYSHRKIYPTELPLATTDGTVALEISF